MSDMTITEFLEDRISEDEDRAGSGWSSLGKTRWETDNYGRNMLTPAAILAECAAKRAIIEAQHWTPRERPTDAQLHFRSSHPAYEYATTEGQRKAWDDADEPPEGEGWERNVDSGDNGWERFDFHEESYWRRLKPEDQRKEWRQYIPRELKALAAVYADHPEYQEEWA